jgi:hypothetical protein
VDREVRRQVSAPRWRRRRVDTEPGLTVGGCPDCSGLSNPVSDIRWSSCTAIPTSCGGDPWAAGAAIEIGNRRGLAQVPRPARRRADRRATRSDGDDCRLTRLTGDRGPGLEESAAASTATSAKRFPHVDGPDDPSILRLIVHAAASCCDDLYPSLSYIDISVWPNLLRHSGTAARMHPVGASLT